MKKLFMLVALMFGLASCQNEPEDLNVVVGGEQDVMINVSLPDETRTGSADGFNLASLKNDNNYQFRYILEIYLDGGTDDQKYRDVKYSDETSISFPVRLAPGRAYSFAVWADVVEQVENAPGLYYNAESLKNISINESNWTAMDEKRDAFYGKASLGKNDPVAGMSTITLTRPFAKVRVISTDIDAVRNFDLDPTNVSVEYLSKLYTSFDAVSGAAVGATTSNKIVTADYTTAKYGDFDTAEATLFADYIFVPANGTIQFAMTVNAAAGEINTASFTTPIPVEVNKVTTIKGDVLTEGGNVSVKIENELGEKETINMVNSANSLQETINKIEDGKSGNVKLGGNIDLGNIISIGTLSTRAAEPTYGLLIPAGKSVVLDLNGFTISHSKECKASYSMIQNNGNLTIIDSSEAKSGKISFKDTSAGDPSFGWGSYTISNYGGTIVVENGTIEHLGEQDAHMICAIWQYSGSTTINGGVISTPNYRSARLWGGDMTINGGEFEGQLWLQAVDNTSNLTINGGTFAPRGNDSSSVFVSNDTYTVKFAVTGGHFTTKIGASKPFGCITGGTFTTAAKEGTSLALVNDDYTWVETNGLWTLGRKPNIVKIGEVGYTSLAKAVAAVKDGETITLVENVTFDENSRQSSGGTWYEGLYYTGNKSFTIDLNDKTITQNGAVNDYLFLLKNDTNTANTINFKNGTLDAGTSAYCALCTSTTSTAKITINLENVNLVGNNFNGGVAKIRGGAELNVKAGTVITGNDNYVGIECVNATTNIYEGAKIYQKGTSSYAGSLAGVSNGGVLNVYGGEGTSAKGGFIAMTSGGTINISGGEWIANTDGAYANSNNSVLIAQSAKGAKSVINVTGGTFKGGYNCYGDKAGDAQINIKGGNFNANPASYVAKGYEAVEENGVWTITYDPYYDYAKVATAEALQAAINNAVEGENKIRFTADIVGDVEIIQENNVKILIDGANKSFTGIMATKGYGADTNVALKIANINFIAKEGADACILSPDRNSTNPAKYSNSQNVTVENCTFTDPDGVIGCAAVRHSDGGDTNWTLNGCSVDNTMHSILQVNNVLGKLTLNNCTVNSKNGANFNSCTNVEMSGCNFDVLGYAVRIGVKSGGDLAASKNFTIANCTLKSACNDGDPIIEIRQSAVNATIDLRSSTLNGTTEISGATDATTIIR